MEDGSGGNDKGEMVDTNGEAQCLSFMDASDSDNYQAPVRGAKVVPANQRRVMCERHHDVPLRSSQMVRAVVW